MARAIAVAAMFFILSASGYDVIQTPSLVVTSVKKEEVPGLPSVLRVYADMGTNKCAFLVPRGFRLDTGASNRITAVAPNNDGYISMQPVSLVSSNGLAFGVKACRVTLLAEYPGAKILAEISRNVAGHHGHGFDIQISVSGGGVQDLRVIFVPTICGVMEFKVAAAPKDFQALIYKMNNLLLSFDTSEDGELNTVPLSNKF